MTKLSLAKVTLDDLSRLARLEGCELGPGPWELAPESLDAVAQAQLGYLATKLSATRSTTLIAWSREYTERTEADVILRALRYVARRAP